MIAASVPAAEAMVWTMLFSRIVASCEEAQHRHRDHRGRDRGGEGQADLEPEIDVGRGEQQGDERRRGRCRAASVREAVFPMRVGWSFGAPFGCRSVERMFGISRCHGRGGGTSPDQESASRARGNGWQRRSEARRRATSAASSTFMRGIVKRRAPRRAGAGRGDAEEGHGAGHAFEHIAEILAAHVRRRQFDERLPGQRADQRRRARSSLTVGG